MFNMKNAIGWIGNTAVFAVDGGFVFVDMRSGKRKFVKVV